jgi:hypothetical protein
MSFNLSKQSLKISELIGQNNIVGCSMSMNKSLAQIVKPIPQTALMHDWWCALWASLMGSIIFIPEALVFYRTHSKNASGAGKKRTIIDFFTQYSQLQNDLSKKIIQFASFLKNVKEKKDSLNIDSQKIVELEEIQNFLTDFNFNKIPGMLKKEIHLQNNLRTVAFYLLLLLQKRSPIIR